MILSLVVAASDNNAIGKQNKLLWHLPNDLKFLKNITWGMPVAMGRVTFESVDSKPLPGRINIIITRQKDFEADGVVVVNSIKDAIFFAGENDYNELMILGGAQVYEEAMPRADKIYLTRVHALFADADAFFPDIDGNRWKRTSQQNFPADEKHQYPYSFEVWERK
ncbi:MAG TPA: dihydrofolate reductase [Chitinophagaceae bacterium]|jgi:dihydrofolate reductase|nr:dihydrofolate reductase [Chitinophagaceae bacterium]